MSYIKDLKCQPRRPATKHLDPAQLLEEMNSLVDKSNNSIARALAHAEQWQRVAAEYHAENERVIAELNEAKKEIERLKKQLTAKAGKNKKRWLEREQTK